MSSIPQKICRRCKEPKALDAFSNSAREKDGRNPYCRPCIAVMGKANRDAHPKQPISSAEKRRRRTEKGLPRYSENERAQNYARTIRKRKRNAAWVRAFKVEHGCADCGYNADHYALHFDHLPGKGKSGNVSSMIANNQSLQRIQEEIAKCEVVCANCHAGRTARRKI